MFWLIADGCELTRQGFLDLLLEEDDAAEIRQAGSLAQARALLALQSPDLLVLDIELAGNGAEATLRDLRRRHPEMRIVVLSRLDDRVLVLTCLGAGVHGYLCKTLPAAHIARALRTIMAGGIYVPEFLTRIDEVDNAASLHSAMMSPATERRFTGRQREVLALLAEGRSTKEIARTLDLAVGTVKVHLAGLYRSLGARSRMEAVIRAGALRP